MTIRLRTLANPDERAAAVPALARLRMRVFREWPYLYDGTESYEADYLTEFMAEPGSVLVIAEAEGDIVGAATASPMAGQNAAFQRPFSACTMDVARLFYFGESVLLPEFRGHGIGHRFFDAREAAAREAGASACCFCAVIRPADHPLRPDNTRDLHPFWRARGYAPAEGLTCSFAWKDIDQPEETGHVMQFWLRELRP
tara:strand:+ start:21562 stop:22158 length:597 start_codon:yes stop_codon:yes gene_type:complete